MKKLLVAALFLGCQSGGLEGDANRPLDITEVTRRLDALLPRGSVRLRDFSSIDVTKLRLLTWPVEGGGEIAEIVLPRFGSGIGGFVAVLAAADGRLLTIPLARETTASSPMISAPIGPAGAVLAGCPSATVDGAAVTTTPSGAIACRTEFPTILGRAAADGDYVQAQGANYSLNIETRVAANPAGDPKARVHVDYPMQGPVVPRFVRELTPGVFEWVITVGSGSTALYGRSDTTETKTTTALQFPPGNEKDAFADWARGEKSGSILFDRGGDSNGTIVRWHVESDGKVETVATSEAAPFGPWASYGFGAAVSVQTRPNEDDPSHLLTVPVAARARAFVGGALKTIDVPPTPCIDGDACRRIGESTLLGVVNVGAVPVAVYAVWAWLTDGGGSKYVTFVAAPVDRTTSGAMVCTPKAAHCADRTSREVCRADGTAWEPASCDASAPICDGGSCVACTDPARQCPAPTGPCLEAACTGPTCGTKAKAPGAPCVNSLGNPSVCGPSGCGFCVPGDSRCGTAAMDAICSAEGVLVPTKCPGGCALGKCVTVTAIAAGSDSTCALMSNKSVRCWGRIAGGAKKPIETTSIPNAEGLAVGGNHACVRTPKETRCWGVNDKGQLGIGFSDTTVHATPELVPGGLADGATDISAGATHTCVVAKNDVVCWGGDSDGQIGNGVAATATTSPVKVLSMASKVAAGGFHTCAIKTTGSLACWGRNDVGQVGAGMGTFLTPTDLTGTSAAQVSLGLFHGCALSPLSGVSCWGSGGGGQLGDGGFGNAFTPTMPIAGLSAASISIGGNSSYALKTDGAVMAWGLNDKGQLGVGVATTTSATPMPVTLGGKVVQLTAGGNHACALLEGSVVRCWGFNDQGQLGDGTNTQRDAPVDVLF